MSGPLKNNVLEVMGIRDRHIVSMGHSEEVRNDLSLLTMLNTFEHHFSYCIGFLLEHVEEGKNGGSRLTHR